MCVCVCVCVCARACVRACTYIYCVRDICYLYICLLCTIRPLLLQQTVEVALTEAGKDLKALKDAVGVHIRMYVCVPT